MKDCQRDYFPYQTVIEATNWFSLVKRYLQFQVQFRFFYRDILEIAMLVPDAKQQYQKQIEKVIEYNKNGIYLSVGKGYTKPEPHEGYYETLATHAWAILNAWLTVREVLGDETVSIKQGVFGLMELHHPHLTEKGLVFYQQLKDNLTELVDARIEPVVNA